MLFAFFFVGGNAATAAVEWVLRTLNPFEAKLSKLWWILNLIPAVMRRLVAGIATVTFSYTLAQFLALFCLFLMSAFIQITIKVREYAGPLAVVVCRRPRVCVQFWDSRVNCFGDCGADVPWSRVSLIGHVCTIIMVLSTLAMMGMLITNVWRLVWDSVMGFHLIKVRLWASFSLNITIFSWDACFDSRMRSMGTCVRQ
jgi:hypothetical protein